MFPAVPAAGSHESEPVVSIADVRWVKAVASAANGNCVEVARLADGGVLVRGGKDADGPALYYTPQEWAAFLHGAKAGEFDRLV